MEIDLLLNKVPPHNIEAEQACLGCMMLSREAVAEGIERLKTDDFYKESHRKIFNAIVSLFDANQAIDLVTVSTFLKDRNQFEEVGGADYLAALLEAVPSTANFSEYVNIVIEKSTLRKLIAAANQIIAYAYKTTGEITDLEQIMDKSEQLIFEISQKRISRDFIKIGDMMPDVVRAIEELIPRKEHITGIPSGIYKLDELTSGFQKSDFIVIAGRPSKGKTSFALNIAEFVAIEKRIPVGIFSLEMSKEQILYRMLASQSKINVKSIRTGYLSNEDFVRLTNAASILHEAPIYIDDSPSLTLMELRAKARRACSQYGIQIFLIDYLQLINLPGKYENRQQEISVISRSLKALARELNIPVIALSQLSRKVESRENQRPRLSDLRESGAIEQDADVVIFIHTPTTERDESESNEVRRVIECKLLLEKQRNGPTGEVDVLYLRDYTKFVNPEFRHEYEFVNVE